MNKSLKCIRQEKRRLEEIGVSRIILYAARRKPESDETREK